MNFLLTSILFFATTVGDNLRSDFWGIAWTNDYNLASSVSRTNTPGNTNYTIYRHRAPVYYAFLDGFATRAAVAISNFNSDVVAVVHANNSPRFSFFLADEGYDDLMSYAENLQNLNVGGAHQSWWSSSAYDNTTALTNAPSVASFGWTQNVISNLYAGYRTRWLPAFGANVSANSVFSFRETSEICPHGVVWQYILPAISLGDSNVWVCIYGEDGGGSYAERYRQSLPPFDDVYKSYYGVTNGLVALTNLTLRHSTEQMAEMNRALAMVDRAIHINDDVVAYTNRCNRTYTIEYESKAELGPLWIDVDSSGSAEIDWSHSWPQLSLSGSIKTVSTNSAMYFMEETTSPRLRCSKPSLECGAGGFSIPELSGVANLSTDYFSAFAERVLALWPEGEEYVEVDMASYLSGAYDEVDLVVNGFDTTFTLSQSLPSMVSGNYSCEGRVSIESQYSYIRTELPRLPYTAYSFWPGHTRFKNAGVRPYRSLVFASFADVATNIGWNTSINFDGGSRRDPEDQSYFWKLRNDWGYRCLVDDYDSYGWYLEGLRQLLPSLEAKIDVLGMDNPAQYTGLSASDLSTVINNFNTNYSGKVSLGFAVTTIGERSIGEYTRNSWNGHAYLRKGSSIIEVYQRNDDGSVGSIMNPNGILNIASRAVSFGVSTSTAGVTINENERSVDTHVKAATEANFDFPQLTTRDYIIHNR